MASIPWFVINFGINMIGQMVMGAITHFVSLFVFAPIAVVVTWLIMMGTSLYSLGYLILLRKEKRIKTLLMVVHGWLQVMFCTDVIGILVLRRQMKKASDKSVPE